MPKHALGDTTSSRPKQERGVIGLTAQMACESRCIVGVGGHPAPPPRPCLYYLCAILTSHLDSTCM